MNSHNRNASRGGGKPVDPGYGAIAREKPRVTQSDDDQRPGYDGYGARDHLGYDDDTGEDIDAIYDDDVEALDVQMPVSQAVQGWPVPTTGATENTDSSADLVEEPGQLMGLRQVR